MPLPTGEQTPAGTATGTPPATGAPAGTAAPAAGTPPAPAAGDTGAQGQPTQAVIDAIIARERRRAETELATVRSEYDAKIAALTPPAGADADKNKPTDDAIAAARKPLEDAVTAEKAKRTALEKNLVTTMVEAAAKDTTAPKVAAMLADGLVRLKDDGTVEVVDAKGQPRYTASGPMTLAELVAEISAANDFLVPASVRNGAGYKGAHTQAQQSVPEQIAALEGEGKFAEAGRLKSKQLAGMLK